MNMKTLRTLFLAGIAMLTLLLPVADQTTAQAGPQPVQHSGHHRIYWVYYRSSPHAAWVVYGGYYNANQAAQAVNYFRYYRYDAFYR